MTEQNLKMLVFSDLHITNKNAKYEKQEGISDLLTAQLKYVEYLCRMCRGEKINVLLFLGDWTDQSNLDPVTSSYSNQMLASLQLLAKETDCKVVLLEGNHCITNKNGGATVLSAAKPLIPGVHIVTQTSVLDFQISVEGCSWELPLSFYCFPYHSDYPQMERGIAKANDEVPDSCFSVMLFHFPTTNAVLDNGLPSKKGVNLSREITSNFDLVLGGDFHLHQQLVNNEKAYYCGAPFDLKFGEHTERGSVIIELNMETGDIERLEKIKNPYQIRIDSASVDELDDIYSEDLSAIIRIQEEVSRKDVEKIEELKRKGARIVYSPPKIKSDLVATETLKVIDGTSKAQDVVKEELKEMKATNVSRSIEILERAINEN